MNVFASLLAQGNFGDVVPSKISLGLAARWQSLQNYNYYSYYYYYYYYYMDVSCHRSLLLLLLLLFVLKFWGFVI